MRTFPNMTDMRRTDADKTKDAPMGMISPQTSDLPDYDYGLNISFNSETLEKLDLDSDVHVGDFIHIHGFAQVTSVNQLPGADKPDRVSMVLTHICCAEDEDEENETDGEG